jgi:hypothetical protein
VGTGGPSVLDPQAISEFPEMYPGAVTVDPGSPLPESNAQDGRDRALLVFFGVILISFVIALFIWWVLFQYDQKPGQVYGLGFWVPSDRPGWLPLHSVYGPLVGKHYFGDFFQLYYAVRSHAPYSNPVSHTGVNPGYLMPLALVSWLPYPAGGYVYLGLLLTAWVLPACFIARRSYVMAVAYLLAATLSVPGLLALDIGQPEIFVYVLAVAAFHQMIRRPELSTVLMGIAIAIKPYMALFLALYLFRRQYRMVIEGLLLGVALNVATAFYLVKGMAATVHLWSVILQDSLGYGSGSALKGWNHAPFLRDNASLFGISYTFASLHVPGLRTVGHALAGHYTAFSMVVLVVTLLLFWRYQARMALEVQWLYLAVVFLLVPSYTIGYAWLLLLVPFVSAALGGVGETTEGRPRFGLLQSKAVFITVALVIVPYPANIALPHALAASNPAYGPNANTVMTPVLLLVLLFLILWKSARMPQEQPALGGLRSLGNGGGRREALHRARTSSTSLKSFDRDFGMAVLAAAGAQVLGAFVAFSLSVVQPAASASPPIPASTVVAGDKGAASSLPSHPPDGPAPPSARSTD